MHIIGRIYVAGTICYRKYSSNAAWLFMPHPLSMVCEYIENSHRILIPIAQLLFFDTFKVADTFHLSGGGLIVFTRAVEALCRTAVTTY